MIKGIFNRLAYARYLLRPGFWIWLKDRIDYIVMDHVEPWSVLKRRPRSMIHPTVSFRCAENVVIGERTRIQNGCILWASPNAKIEIGDFTGLGPGVMIFSSNHRFVPGVPYIEQPWDEKGVRIGRDVWVGAGVILVPGASVGDGSVVAAGSVVTGDIPPDSIAAGIPAKVLRSRLPREASEQAGGSGAGVTS